MLTQLELWPSGGIRDAGYSMLNRPHRGHPCLIAERRIGIECQYRVKPNQSMVYYWGKMSGTSREGGGVW